MATTDGEPTEEPTGEEHETANGSFGAEESMEGDEDEDDEAMESEMPAAASSTDPAAAGGTPTDHSQAIVGAAAGKRSSGGGGGKEGDDMQYTELTSEDAYRILSTIDPANDDRLHELQAKITPGPFQIYLFYVVGFIEAEFGTFVKYKRFSIRNRKSQISIV